MKNILLLHGVGEHYNVIKITSRLLSLKGYNSFIIHYPLNMENCLNYVLEKIHGDFFVENSEGSYWKLMSWYY